MKKYKNVRLSGDGVIGELADVELQDASSRLNRIKPNFTGCKGLIHLLSIK